VRYNSDTLARGFRKRIPPSIQHVAALPYTVRIATNLLIIGLWLWLYRPVFDYLAIIFSREEFRTNQVMLVGVVLLIAAQVRKRRPRIQIDAPPQMYYPALILAIGGSTLYLAVERFLDINTLSASLFGLASYGLLGLWMQPGKWQRGLPAALLLVGVLPFGEHMQTFIGYPVRILTATVVRDGLSAAGVTSIGVDTILVLENGVSQVDLPCSGVKSLWTGMLFLIATTWINRHRFNLGWLVTAFGFVGLLLTANLVRVGVLVVVGQVAGWRLTAEMLHVPLGVLGFMGACAAAVALLRWQRRAGPAITRAHRAMADAEAGQHEKTGDIRSTIRLQSISHPTWFAPALAATILLMALGYASRPQSGLAQAPPNWEFPAEMVTTPTPLKPDELEWLTRGGAESADRRRFEWRGVTGSMILITSKTWRAHHRPERCFEVYGLSLDDTRTHLVDSNFPVRFVSLSYGEGRDKWSATYWFQSRDGVTGDYGARMWADLSPEREQWVLVTILFDGVYDPNTPDIQAFYTALRNAVARGLEGGPSS
jgi:exosortase O